MVPLLARDALPANSKSTPRDRATVRRATHYSNAPRTEKGSTLHRANLLATVPAHLAPSPCWPGFNAESSVVRGASAVRDRWVDWCSWRDRQSWGGEERSASLTYIATASLPFLC